MYDISPLTKELMFLYEGLMSTQEGTAKRHAVVKKTYTRSFAQRCSVGRPYSDRERFWMDKIEEVAPCATLLQQLVVPSGGVGGAATRAAPASAGVPCGDHAGFER